MILNKIYMYACQIDETHKRFKNTDYNSIKIKYNMYLIKRIEIHYNLTFTFS